MNQQYLEHHGKMGMRWGHRNSSGSTTSVHKDPKVEAEQLKITKGKVDVAATVVKESGNVHAAVRSAVLAKNMKDTSSMTDQELKDRVARMTLDQQYTTLSANQTSKGKVYITSALAIAGSTLAVASSALSIAVAMKALRTPVSAVI